MIQLRQLAMATLIALLAAACQKTQPKPATTAQTAATVAASQQRGPNIVALSIAHHYAHGSGGSVFDVTFDSGTASFFGGSLYMHYKTSAATLYSAGTPTAVWASPVATYTLPVSLAPGNYNMFFSDGTGTSYPAGAAASPVYTITI